MNYLGLVYFILIFDPGKTRYGYNATCHQTQTVFTEVNVQICKTFLLTILQIQFKNKQLKGDLLTWN